MSEERLVNADHDSLKQFVDRLFNVETDFADVKADYTDTKKDMKTEIKGREDETGVTWDQVVALTKTRMDEVKALDEQSAINQNLELYEQIFGFSAPPTGETEKGVDPLD